MKPHPQRPTPRKADRKRAILAEPTVRGWYDERSLRSVLSADVDARKLALLLERLELTPTAVVRVAKEQPDRLRARLVRYASEMKKAGKLDTYIEKTFSGLRSYLAFRHVAFDGFPRLSGMIQQSIANERTPTPEELGRVLQRLSLRGRVVALLMAHSGLRPQVLGSYRGERGLTLGDLPDLDLKKLAFPEGPFLVRVRADLSKTGMAYVTFGSRESAGVLCAYLAERRAAREVLSGGSPVVAGAGLGDLRGAARKHVQSARFSRGFLATGNVTAELARILHASAGKGERLRPYSLRGFFSSRLLLAESAGKITRDFRETFLGHDLKSVSRRYNLSKKWGPDEFRVARAQYKGAEPWLLTTSSPMATAEEIQREAAVLLLTGLKGKSEADARKMVEGKSGPELADLLRSGAKPREQAVPVEDVPKLLGDGWEFVSALNGTLAVLRAPASPTTAPAPPLPPSGAAPS